MGGVSGDDGDDMTIFIIVVSVIGGLVVIGLAIWLVCCCARSISTPPLKTQPPAPAVMPAPGPLFLGVPPSQFAFAPRSAPQSLAFIVEEDVSCDVTRATVHDTSHLVTSSGSPGYSRRIR